MTARQNGVFTEPSCHGDGAVFRFGVRHIRGYFFDHDFKTVNDVTSWPHLIIFFSWLGYPGGQGCSSCCGKTLFTFLANIWVGGGDNRVAGGGKYIPNERRGFLTSAKILKNICRLGYSSLSWPESSSRVLGAYRLLLLSLLILWFSFSLCEVSETIKTMKILRI